MLLLLLILIGLHLTAAAAMMVVEWFEHKRIDPVGCLAWPWWFGRYTKRMWQERSHQYDTLRQRAPWRPEL